MTTVQLSINISAEDLERIARDQLGLVSPKETQLRVAYHPRSEAVAHAIAYVIRAVEKLDRDQYTHGEASAVTALFEAGKRLRKAVAGEQNARTQKGSFHV